MSRRTLNRRLRVARRLARAEVEPPPDAPPIAPNGERIVAAPNELLPGLEPLFDPPVPPTPPVGPPLPPAAPPPPAAPIAAVAVAFEPAMKAVISGPSPDCATAIWMLRGKIRVGGGENARRLSQACADRRLLRVIGALRHSDQRVDQAWVGQDEAANLSRQRQAGGSVGRQQPLRIGFELRNRRIAAIW